MFRALEAGQRGTVAAQILRSCQGWEAQWGGERGIPRVQYRSVTPLACPWSFPSLWPLPLGESPGIFLPAPPHLLDMESRGCQGRWWRAAGMWQGCCQRHGPGVRADVCPGASLSLPRAEIPGCMPSRLTHELASASHRVTRRPDPLLLTTADIVLCCYVTMLG